MDFENNYKQFLKDSGCNEDEAMSRKEMMELQAAINNSKDTASLEEEKREYVRQAEEMQKADMEKAAALQRQRSASKSPADIFENEQEVQPSQKEFDITFQDMPECAKESLDIVYHKPAYGLPIPFNPKYRKCSIQERTKLLCDYYTKMGQLKAKLARRSLRRAPFSKPILPSLSSKNSLLKSRSSEDGGIEEPGQIPPQEFYVSRAGRQVKRKIYTEEPEIEDNDFEMTSLKKNKFTNSDTKITLDTPFVAEENHEEKSASKPVKTKKETPSKRSLLQLPTKKSARTENLFEKLLEDEVKKKQQQQEMDNFEKTLPPLEDIEDEDKLLMDDVQESSAVTSDENFVRKRVVPPIPGRRPAIRAKKQPSVEDFDKIDVIQETPPGSPKLLKQYMNLNKSLTKSNSKMSKSKENQSKEEVTISILEKTPCPICNKRFLQSEIMNHAANCGIEEEIEEFPETSTKLRCELCEKEFVANTNYEVHVKECIAKKVTDL